MRDNDTSLLRAIRGPVTLITVGVLFALNNFTEYRFHQTWPVLLIVFGLLSLVRRSMEPAPPAPAPGYVPPPYNYQPPATQPGSYRQSQYNEPPAPPTGPVKGGFGSSSATQKGNEPEGSSGGAV
jgi:hypothetical protein